MTKSFNLICTTRWKKNESNFTPTELLFKRCKLYINRTQSKRFQIEHI